jgi:hypothetical protein
MHADVYGDGCVSSASQQGGSQLAAPLPAQPHQHHLRLLWCFRLWGSSRPLGVQLASNRGTSLGACDFHPWLRWAGAVAPWLHPLTGHRWRPAGVCPVGHPGRWASSWRATVIQASVHAIDVPGCDGQAPWHPPPLAHTHTHTHTHTGTARHTAWKHHPQALWLAPQPFYR